MKISDEAVQAAHDAKEALEYVAKQPCETQGVEDLEGGCCRTCRARKSLPYLTSALPFLQGATSPRAQALEEAAKIADDFVRNNRGYDSPEAHAAFTVSSEIARYIRALSSQPVADHVADAGKMVADGWLPIETAPRDGTEVLAWRYDCGPFIASFTSCSAFPLTQAEIDELDEDTLFKSDWFTQLPQALRLEGSEVPTHWRPLPASPGASE